MIYLLDDNLYNQMALNYKVNFVDELKLHPQVKWLDSLEAINIVDSIIADARCILIHNSINPIEVKLKLIAFAEIKLIPYVIFSNSFTATIFESNFIREIKKDRMYHNLLAFIKEYEASNNITLQILSWGKDYEYEKALIIQDRIINGTLFNNRRIFNYEIAFPGGSNDQKDLFELVAMSNISSNFDSFQEEHGYDSTLEVIENLISRMVLIIKQKNEK